MQTQTMNSESPQSYYSNPAVQQQQQQFPGYMQNNGREPSYPQQMVGVQQYSNRFPPQQAPNYGQAMPAQFYYPPGPLSPQIYPNPNYSTVPPSPFFQPGPRPMGNFSVQLVRPNNENGYVTPSYHTYAHTNSNLGQHPAVYPQQFYPQQYTAAPQSYQQPQQHAINISQPPLPPNNSQPQQSHYTAPSGPTTQPQLPPQTHPQQSSLVPVDPSSQTPSNSQTGQQSLQTNVYPAQAAPVDKRQRKPLAIVDPVSHKEVEIEAANNTASSAISPSSTTTTSDSRQPESATDSTSSIASTSVPKVDPKETQQKQAIFREQFAKLLGDTMTPQSKSKSNDEAPSATGSSKSLTSKVSESSENVPSSSSSSSGSKPLSREKSPTRVSSMSTASVTSNKTAEQPPQPGLPGIRTRTFTDDNKEKRERSDSQKQQEPEVSEDTKPSSDEAVTVSTTDNISASSNETKDDQDDKLTTEAVVPSTPIESKPTPLLSATASLECVTPPQTPTPSTNTESFNDADQTTVDTSEQSLSTSSSTALPNQRLRYDRQELLKMRENVRSQTKPANLPNIDIVMNSNDNQFNNRQPYGGTGSHGGNRAGYNRQSSTNSSSHPSLVRGQPPTPGSAGMNVRMIQIPTVPDFGNRVDNPYKPTDINKLDATEKVLRDIKSILNKVTPQTFEKLQKQLESLEVDRYERLDGMIRIFFAKAVDEPGFSFLYAKLCKQFQKKQVTVPNDEGKLVTHYFRQILLTRCQKEFENDYRQEIEYDKRKSVVDAIVDDEKKQKEESEKLAEDLAKAKRKKLGNIFFIGELFKLQMLTDTIMYDCIEYLLKDKTDEESIECLCRLLVTIGKELDIKASEKQANKTNLEKHYRDLVKVVDERQASARIRFMIQDLMDLRKANWVARRAETKPMTIDEIHEQERQKREQQERDQDRDRQQRREQNRAGGGGSSGGNYSQQQYSDSRGSRGSGIKQQPNRPNEDRVQNSINVNALRNQGAVPISLAPQRAWSKGSGVDKKPEEDRSFASRTGKPPAGPVQQLKSKTGSSQGPPGYQLQRQSSRELARESSTRDRENALQSLKKTTASNSGVTNVTGSSSMTNSREGSRNVSREQSRNASRESSLSERTSAAGTGVTITKTSTPPSSGDVQNATGVDTTSSFDEEKTQTRVHSLIEEYTENYNERSDRPVQEAIEDLSSFGTSNVNQQAIIVRELFTNVFEAKPRARMAVGHLLDTAVHQNVISKPGFFKGFELVVEIAPDYAVDIPLIWQYIGEIIGAFMGAPSSNMVLLKSILKYIPENKSKQMFQHIIRYATEFSSKSRIQRLWQSSSLSLDDIDSSLNNEYDWLSETPVPESGDGQQAHAGNTFTSSSSSRSATSTPSPSAITPHPDPQLVKLFKSVSDQGVTVPDAEIIAYIHANMDSSEKFYIRNIVLSYLEACLINRDPQQKKIQEDIAKKRMTILNSIIEHKPDAEIQAVYAIQNFVNKLEHPSKMARLLFDIFYDEECVSEDAFFEWLKHPDQSETEGHAVVEMSTKDFFTWLQQAETEVEEGEEEEA